MCHVLCHFCVKILCHLDLVSKIKKMKMPDNDNIRASRVVELPFVNSIHSGGTFHQLSTAFQSKEENNLVIETNKNFGMPGSLGTPNSFPAVLKP